MTFQSGPFYMQTGNSIQFGVEFLDSKGNIAVTPAAAMTVVYTNTSNTVQTDSFNLTANGNLFYGTWSSTSAALGLATWTVTALPSSVQGSNGQLMVIQRKGSS